MRNRNKDSFWPSYVDIMTTLFAIMVVLFAVSYSRFRVKENELRTEKERLESILQLEKQFKNLSQSPSLQYDTIRKMFFAKDFQEKEIFEPNEDVIKPEYDSIVKVVGNDILNVLKLLDQNKNFRYQMVIEGYAAIPWDKKVNGAYNPDSRDMYLLSYKRALALYLRWTNVNGLDFRKYNTEVIIAGSGFNGENRAPVEDHNKRFVVQIIPKINRPKAEN